MGCTNRSHCEQVHFQSLDDLWPQWEREKSDQEKEPDWVATEREQFFQHRDKDKDKRLNRVRREGGREGERGRRLPRCIVLWSK